MGCSWDRFDDLANQAPALMIEQEGTISSASFGDHLAGMERPGEAAGGTLFLSGNGEAALATVLISPNGEAKYAQSEQDKLKEQLDNPNRINAVASVPPGLNMANAIDGPFAYVGSAASGMYSVRVIDTGRYTSQSKIINMSTWPEAVEGLGLSVTAAEFGTDGRQEDLAVGAQNAVVLLKATTWPTFGATPIVVSTTSNPSTAGDPSTDWPLGEFSKIVSGDLVDNAEESQNHEVVASVPAENSVVVIYDINSLCFEDDTIPRDECAKILRLDNQSALGFGSSLLIADVDQDGTNELIVGADESSKVFVFSFKIMESGTGETKTRTLEATPKATLVADGSRGLGTSLAFGTLLGGPEAKLAVGAPGTEVDGVAGAGRIYFFGSNLQLIAGADAAFVSPENNTLLGLSLARIPFRATDNATPKYLLAASGRDAIFVFFADIGGGEAADVRIQ